MKFILFLLLALCIACPAHAEQNFFLKKHLTTDTGEAKPAIPETSATGTQTPAAPVTPTLATRTPISSDQANGYYNNCLAQKSATFTASGQQMLCACTAAQMQKEMSVEEVQLMSQNTPEGQAMRDKMTLYVYAPCMKYPTHDLIYSRCINDPQIKAAAKNAEALCQCMGDGMADFIDQKGPENLVASMRQNPGDLDPLGTLMNSDAFTQASQQVMQTCAPKGMQ